MRGAATFRALLVICAWTAPPATAAQVIADGPSLDAPFVIVREGKTYSLEALPAPDLSQTEETVRRTLEETRRSLVRLTGEETDPAKLSAAWGRLGELYHAHHVYIPADPAYANAITFDPESTRWIYLRGWLAEQTTRTGKAIDYYQRVLELDPSHEPARLRLALAYIDDGQGEKAQTLLTRPFTTPGMEAGVQFARGRLALQKRDYRQAAELLEQVLELQPHASRAYSMLGMAYRGLGDVEGARRALSRYGDGKPKIPDPATDRLDALLTGDRTQLHRGLVGIQEGRYDIAAAAFGEASAANPANTDLRVSYARALYLDGRRDAGRAELEAALEQDPDHVLGNFLHGLLLAAEGQDDAAAVRFRKTLSLSPGHAGAHHFLGDVLMREGDFETAARHYEAAAVATPQDNTARTMGAMALLRAGAPHERAIRLLEEAHETDPANAYYTYLLAWLLAGSPDAGVRNGERALELAERLIEQQDGPGNAEVQAMALAESGQFGDAQALQSRVVMAAFQGGRFDLTPRLRRCLEAYREERACHQLWPESDPVYRVPPIDPAGPFRDYPTPNPY